MVTRSWTCRAVLLLALTAGSALAQPNQREDEPAPAQPTTASEQPAPATAPQAQPVSPPKATASARPGVHHGPPSTAKAHEPLVIKADISHPQLVRRALVVYRSPDQAEYREVELRRASDGPYAAEIPATDVRWPSLFYAVEIERVDGTRVSVFASRSRPHQVLVPEELMDIRERALHQRLGGRRSVVSTAGEYVSFGRSQAQNLGVGTTSVNDHYYRIDAGYTYRPLRAVTEFGMRGGIVRGTAPVPVRDPVPGQSEAERFDVGLNYGAALARFRFHDRVHLDAETLISVTEVGFSWGGGGALLLGDPYGSKLTLGFESIQVFGNRVYSRMDVVVVEGVTIAPVIEVTNMPSAEQYGVRLLGELGLDLGAGFGVALRGGYQARQATSGGPSGGATLSYAF